MSSKKILRYIAAFCFAISAGIVAVNLIQNGFKIWSIIGLIGNLLMAAAVALNIPLLTKTAGGILIVVAVRSLTKSMISCMQYMGYIGIGLDPNVIVSLAAAIIFLAYWVLIVAASFKPQKARELLITAGEYAIIRLIVMAVGNKLAYGYWGLTVVGVLSQLVLIAAAFLLAFEIEGPSAENLKKAFTLKKKSKVEMNEINPVNAISDIGAEAALNKHIELPNTLADKEIDS